MISARARGARAPGEQKSRSPSIERALSRTVGFLIGEGMVGGFLLGSLMAVGWSIQSADWARTPSSLLVTFLGFTTGLLLSRMRWPALPLLVGGIVVGLVTVALLTSGISDASGVASRVFQTVGRIVLWGRAAFGGGASADPLPFAFLLSTLTWLMAYLCAWLVFRLRNYWGAVCISGAVLVVNTSLLQAPGVAGFGLFMLSVLLLHVRLNAFERRDEASDSASRHPRRPAWSTMRSGVLLTVTVMAGAFFIPTGGDLHSLGSVYRLTRWPVEHLSGDFDRLFAGLGDKVPGSFRVFSDQWALGGSVMLSDTASFIVQSPFPVYLKGHSYDTYTSTGWKTGLSETHDLEWTPGQSRINDSDDDLYGVTAVSETYGLGWTPDPSASVTENKGGQEPALITVKPLFLSDIRFTAGDVASIYAPSELEIYAAPTYTISLRNASQNDMLPESIRPIARDLQAAAWSLEPGRQATITRDSLQKLAPPDIVVLDIEYQRSAPASVRFMRKMPNPPDVVSLNVRGDRSSEPYQMTVLLSQAKADALRSAGTAYPGWVADRYLQLPSNMPGRVKELADQIAKGAATAYDKAKAIETYLRNSYEYSLSIDPPSYNRDAVDYFLFTAKKGYCDYFASAMAVMLREEGVPARIITGYAPGEKEQDGSYLVRERDAHSWPAAYFPGYGWIDFEPTPSRPLLANQVESPQDEQNNPEQDEQTNSGQVVQTNSGQAVQTNSGQAVQTNSKQAVQANSEQDVPTDSEQAVPTNSDVGPAPGIADEEPVPPDASSALPMGSGQNGGFRGLALWMLLPLGLFLFILYLWSWVVSEPVRPAEAYWRLLLAGRLAGVRARPADTPYEYARSIGSRWPKVRDQAWLVADAYVKSSYGGKEPTPLDLKAIANSWRSIRSSLLRRVLTLRR